MNRTRKFGSIRMKMLLYSMSLVIFMTILSLYSISILEKYKGQMEGMFEKHLYLSDIEALLDDMDQNLLGFLSTKSSTKLNDYLIDVNTLTLLMQEEDQPLYSMEDVFSKNIHSLIGAYLDEADSAIRYKRQRNVYQYYNQYEETQRIKGYIMSYIQSLNTKQLNRNSRAYIELLGQIHTLQQVTAVIIGTLIVISIAIVYLISAKMVRPIGILVDAAEEIGKGNLAAQDVQEFSEEEWQLLGSAFNKMKKRISSYIEALHQKAETEHKLKDEQLKNIRMAHLLDNARLYALQSQINPHFLFNTINAGVQLSMMERAPKTGEFLDTMSSLFRYNIQKMDSVVTVRDEIGNIKDYYELLKVRFGERIRFKWELSPELMKVPIPPLVLQPIVENAYIHGLSGLEEGGVVTIRTFSEGKMGYILIEDTGKGMDGKDIEKIMGVTEPKDGSGIGIRNVRERLTLFYHKDDVFEVDSQLGLGTSVRIRIPMWSEEDEI